MVRCEINRAIRLFASAFGWVVPVRTYTDSRPRYDIFFSREKSCNRTQEIDRWTAMIVDCGMQEERIWGSWDERRVAVCFPCYSGGVVVDDLIRRKMEIE